MRKSAQTAKTKTPAQIKSKQRVRERGEVFTADREVKAMCDLIPEDEIWSDITKTFLEPACGTGNNMEIRPITFKSACNFVDKYHRHHKSSAGCKFCVGLYDDEKIVGVAICGRPVSRYLDDGLTCEINRLCTDGTPNACSMLYGACCRIAKEMGYKLIITYILESENGASLKASNFICDGIAGGTHWTGVRNRGQKIPCEMKTRWHRQLQ